MKFPKPSDRVLGLLLILAVAIITALLMAGCASTPYQRDAVTPEGTIEVQEVVEHTIPGTGIALWKDVTVPAEPTKPVVTETTVAGDVLKAVTPYAETWWPLLVLAFRRPRSNLVAAAKKAAKGDLAGAGKSLVAATGLTHTPAT